MSKKRHWAIRTLAYDFPDGHVIKPHQHAEHQLVYAATGVMTVHTPRGSWIVPTHRGVWVPGGVEHSIQISGAVAMRTVYLDRRLSTSLPRACRVVSVSPLLRELILHAVAQGTLDRRRAADARLIGVLLDQLRIQPAPALHLPQPVDERAKRIASALLAEPGDRRPLAQLVRRAGASLRTVERLFFAETGMTLGRFRQQLRLVEALRRLAGGEAVTSVALEVGYDSPSAFVSVFRRTFGTTPGRYFRQ